jgi:hypothetical protein
MKLIASYDMVHRYVWYNGYELTIQVSFMANVCFFFFWEGGGGFGSNGFVIKMQPFPVDGHYKMDVISGVGHPRSDSVVPLVLRMVCYIMARAPALYFKSLRITLILLRMGNISGRPYC